VDMNLILKPILYGIKTAELKGVIV